MCAYFFLRRCFDDWLHSVKTPSMDYDCVGDLNEYYIRIISVVLLDLFDLFNHVQFVHSEYHTARYTFWRTTST